MRVVLYTREGGGCSYCDRARAALDARRVGYTEIPLDVGALGKVCEGFDCRVVTFPRVVVDGRLVGGYEDLVDVLEDELMTPSEDRFVYFPVRYNELNDLYRKGVACFWTPQEIDLAKDAEDFQVLTAEERRFVKLILGFFAASDGIVNENIVANMCNTVQAPEARAFYSYQCFNEMQHSETYALLLDTLVRDPSEKASLFSAVRTVPSIRVKADWAMRWLEGSGNVRFSERLVAFAAVEGIMFSSSFCAIFWLRKRGLMPGLCLSNDFISRDEGLHQLFACTLYGMLARRPAGDRVLEIVKGAVEAEKEFVREILPKGLIGMNSESMCQYVEYVADNLLVMLGQGPFWHSACPFDFMQTIGLSGKTNFFEVRNSSYMKPNMGANDASQDAISFSLEADF